MYKGRYVLPKHSFHSNPSSSLLRFPHWRTCRRRMYARIASKWHWEAMKKRIVDYVKSCEVCQRQKSSSFTAAPTITNTRPNLGAHYHGFCRRVAETFGKDTILVVVVDRLSKYAHFIPLKHPFTTTMVAESFMQEMVRLHGFPASIIFDREILLEHLLEGIISVIYELSQEEHNLSPTNRWAN